MNLYRGLTTLTEEGVKITSFELVVKSGVVLTFLHPSDWLVTLNVCDEKKDQQWITPEDLATQPVSGCDGDVIGSLLPTNEQRIKSLLGMADMCAKETSVFNRFENSQENEHN